VGLVADVEFDPYSLECLEDPYPVYRALLEDAPLYHSEKRGFWAVSRHTDVQRCARDWETFSSRSGVDLSGSVGLAGPGGFLDMDPPRHDQLRRIVRSHFTPKAVAALEDEVRRQVRVIGAEIRARGGGDLARDLARPLPLRLGCTLLGFPPADHGELERWFDPMVRRVPGTTAVPASARSAAEAMRAYIDDMAAQRARRPSDDLLSALVSAELRGELTVQERTGICVLLFLAGISTAAGLISTSLYLLEAHPAQRKALLREPATILAAVEELLRYVSPVQALARTATRPVELYGSLLPEGARLLLVFGAANRDPRRFADPDELQLGRKAERNLGFGEGIHFCLGANLARLQMRVVLDTLLPVMPEFSVSGPVRWMSTPGDRGIESLPVMV
jgi:cytochrome P450